jgi:protein disulfide-isomerase
MRCAFPLFETIVLIGLAGALGCDSARLPTWGTLARAEPGDPSPSEAGMPIKFIHGYTRGFEEARELGKPILVFFTAPDCIFSRAMAKETFGDEKVAALSQEFVCIRVDAEEEPAVCEEFRVDAYPTIQFMSPRGIPMNRFTGKKSPEQMAVQMRAALEAIAFRTDYSRQTAVR